MKISISIDVHDDTDTMMVCNMLSEATDQVCDILLHDGMLKVDQKRCLLVEGTDEACIFRSE
jgi:hypothetical protein